MSDYIIIRPNREQPRHSDKALGRQIRVRVFYEAPDGETHADFVLPIYAMGDEVGDLPADAPMKDIAAALEQHMEANYGSVAELVDDWELTAFHPVALGVKEDA